MNGHTYGILRSTSTPVIRLASRIIEKDKSSAIRQLRDPSETNNAEISFHHLTSCKHICIFRNVNVNARDTGHEEQKRKVPNGCMLMSFCFADTYLDIGEHN